MASVHPSVIRQAERLRLDGDGYYLKGRIGAAIDAYTEAIVLNPDVAMSFANRAECFRQKKMWGRVEEDCLKAIDLDPNCFKGHYLLGLALLEKDELATGIKELDRAFNLRRDLHTEDRVMKELRCNLARAKFKAWKLESSKKTCDIMKLKEACEKALIECHQLDLDNSEEAGRTYKEQLESLSQVFDKAAEEYLEAEVPDYLCCKITMDILCDPVVTPSGITYEREAILNHLQKVGKFDPTTRQPLEQNQLMPNLAIKDAVAAFLEKHGWAYESHFSTPCGSDQE